MYLRYTTCFGIHIPCEIIASTKLINTSVTSFTLCVLTSLKFYSLKRFPDFNTVLTIVTMLKLYLQNIIQPLMIEILYSQ